MFNEPILFLTVAGLCLLGYWILPATSPRARGGWLIFCSMWLLAAIAPQALLVALGMTALTFVVSRLFDYWRSKWLLFAAIGGLVAITLQVEHIADATAESDAGLLLTLGLAFVLLKSIGMLVDAYLDGDRLQPDHMLLLNIFFPIHAAGPIELPSAVSRSALSVQRIGVEDVTTGLRRMVLGWFKLAFLSAVLLDYVNVGWAQITTDPLLYSPLSLYAHTALGFFIIYINFSGYCDIAIGFSRLLGLNITENFDKPWLAHNVENFWQRWHRTLGRFIYRNLYAPGARQGWRHEPMIVLAFVLIGLWHHLSLPFLIWGLANGLGFAWARWMDRASRKGPDWWQHLRASLPYRIFAMWLTISFLAVVSRFARLPDIEIGFTYIGGLLGWR
ncbi:MAG: peptidoglycan O-acetyltransferase [Alphaproteobacteria bacterium]